MRLRDGFAWVWVSNFSSSWCFGRPVGEIFGSPDDLKFRSCMTLFWRVTGEEIFREALERYFGGEEDRLTVAGLGKRKQKKRRISHHRDHREEKTGR